MTREMTGGASLTREPGEALFRASRCLDRASFHLVEECVRMAHWERTWVLPVCTVISRAVDYKPGMSCVPGSQQASIEKSQGGVFAQGVFIL